MKYYLSHQGSQKGPWSAEEVLSKINSKEISWTDYLFEESSKEWVLLMEHPKFAGSFKDWVEPKTALSIAGSKEMHELKSKSTGKNEKEWFVLKGENKYGPFEFLELLKMLQEKSLYEYDFVWNSTLPEWKRVAETEEFRSDRIKNLQKEGDREVREAFYRRRFVRASYNASLLVHNSKSVWKGRGLEISSGGAGIIVDHADFEPGQTLFLHFKAGDGVPPFNAICSIVSKQFSDEKEKAIRYGVKFTSISHTVQKAIKAFANKKVA